MKQRNSRCNGSPPIKLLGTMPLSFESRSNERTRTVLVGERVNGEELVTVLNRDETIGDEHEASGVSWLEDNAIFLPDETDERIYVNNLNSSTGQTIVPAEFAPDDLDVCEEVLIESSSNSYDLALNRARCRRGATYRPNADCMEVVLPSGAINIINDKSSSVVGTRALAGEQDRDVAISSPMFSNSRCSCGVSGRIDSRTRQHCGYPTKGTSGRYCPCCKTGNACTAECRCRNCWNPCGVRHVNKRVRDRSLQWRCHCGSGRTHPAPSSNGCTLSSVCACRLQGRACSVHCLCSGCLNPNGARVTCGQARRTSLTTNYCHCPSVPQLDATNRLGKARFCSLPPNELAILEQLGLPNRCACLEQGRACQPQCRCAACQNPHGLRPLSRRPTAPFQQEDQELMDARVPPQVGNLILNPYRRVTTSNKSLALDCELEEIDMEFN